MFKHLFKITLIASLLLIILVTASLSPATTLAAELPDKPDPPAQTGLLRCRVRRQPGRRWPLGAGD
jgi:hypothetical protein